MTLTYPVLSGRIFFCLLLVTVVGFGVAHAFQIGPLEVTSPGGTRIETAPGRLLTLSLRVSNNTSTRKQYESNLVLPAGWRRLAREFAFGIDGGGSDIRLISVSIPAEAAAGEYQIRYSVHDQSNPAASFELAITIVVAAVNEQGLRVVDVPRLVVAGDTYTVVFLLSNKGNTPGLVKLSARSSSGFPATPDSALAHLRAGESRSISVTIKTDASLLAKAQDVVELSAERETKDVVRASSFVDVVPRMTGAEDRFFEFPLQAKLRYAGEQGKSGAQVEIAGSGPLGEGRQELLDILVRTPDIQKKSILGQRDEYHLDYTAQHFEAYLGDKNFALSPLTEYNRFAFGASGNVNLQKFSAGAFYNETRFISPAQKEWAGFLSYRVHENAQISFNYLGKRDSTGSDMITARGLVQPFKSSEVDLEYGLGNSGAHRDDAYSARWSGRESWIAYDTRYVWAGPKYPGYYHDLDFRNVSLTVLPVTNIRLEGYYREEQRNLERDSAALLAPRDRYVLAGVGYANLISIYYRSDEQNDLLPVPHYDRKDEGWQLRAGHSFSGVTLTANADVGSINDKLAGASTPYQRYAVYASIQPWGGQTYGFSAEYSKDEDAATFETQRRLAGSFSAAVTIGESTQLAAAIYGNRTLAVENQTYTLLDVSFEHRFSFGHTVSFRGRQSIFTPSTEGREIAYAVEYSMPLNVPIARKVSSGQLAGRVIDSDKGTGIPNILVYAGGAVAVTDRNGDFLFPSLKPDKYYVQLDMAGVGMTRVALQQLPYEVAITGGHESRFDISLTHSINVSGTLVLYGAAEQAPSDTTQPALVELGGHANAVIELSSGENVNRRVTDSKGRFVFAGIRPGRWTVRVVDGNLPDNTYIEKDSYEIEAASGASEEVAFKILPRKRRIQILQQGKTIEAAPEKGKVGEPAPSTKKPAVSVPLKEKTIGQAPQPPVRKPSPTEPKQVGTMAPVTTLSIVFVPEHADFSIEHSVWSTKSAADSAAARLQKQTGLPARVENVAPQDGKPRFRVLLGAFHTRAQAAIEVQKLRKPTK